VSLQQKWLFTANLQAHLVLEEWVMEEAKRLNEAVLGDMEPTSRQRNVLKLCAFEAHIAYAM